MVSHALVSFMLIDIAQSLINNNRVIPHDLCLQYLMNNVYFFTTSINETIIVDQYLCIEKINRFSKICVNIIDDNLGHH